MQTGIVRTADGLLLPGVGPLAMFKRCTTSSAELTKRPKCLHHDRVVVRVRVRVRVGVGVGVRVVVRVRVVVVVTVELELP